MDSMERTAAKVVTLNIAAVIASIVSMVVANLIAAVVFGFIVNLPIISTILSFPTTPELYAVTGIDFVVFTAGIFVCDKIAAETKAGRKPAFFFVGLYLLVSFAFTTYSVWMTRGFCDILIVNALAVLVSIGVAALGFQKNAMV